MAREMLNNAAVVAVIVVLAAASLAGFWLLHERGVLADLAGFGNLRHYARAGELMQKGDGSEYFQVMAECSEISPSPRRDRCFETAAAHYAQYGEEEKRKACGQIAGSQNITSPEECLRQIPRPIAESYFFD